jgi:hypothetical protein
MKTVVSTYRGFEITFDDGTGNFTAWSDNHDTEFAKPSFSSIKKGVDDYIKSNTEFRPFKALKVSRWGSSVEIKGDPITIVGIRKDNKFTYEDKDGKKRAMSKYDMKDFIVFLPKNHDLQKQILEVMEKERAFNEMVDGVRTKFNKQKKDILDKMEIVTLKDKVQELKHIE